MSDDDNELREQHARMVEYEKTQYDDIPKRGVKEIHPSVVRFWLVLAVLGFALLVFLGQAIECWKYCKDVHDVRELYDPFQSAAIALLGSAVAYYFTDRNNRNA